MGDLLDSRIYDLFGRLENAREPLEQLVTICKGVGEIMQEVGKVQRAKARPFFFFLLSSHISLNDRPV